VQLLDVDELIHLLYLLALDVRLDVVHRVALSLGQGVACRGTLPLVVDLLEQLGFLEDVPESSYVRLSLKRLRQWTQKLVFYFKYS